MNTLVVYDVDTKTKDGRKRLRCVADVCEGFGIRVQDSVFECFLEEEKRKELVSELLSIIDLKKDNLRIYRLRGPSDEVIEVYGIDKSVDLKDALII
jgi:CRISPR-associated protein Cas2